LEIKWSFNFCSGFCIAIAKLKDFVWFSNGYNKRGKNGTLLGWLVPAEINH
jgi:hypothetical protein